MQKRTIKNKKKHFKHFWKSYGIILVLKSGKKRLSTHFDKLWHFSLHFSFLKEVNE